MALCDDLTTKYKRPGDKEKDSGGRDYFEAKTEGQVRYLGCIKENRVVFAHGPAGTGKSFLAAAMAAQALKKGEIERIICVRPAVGSGESIGFLPGTADEKMMPYLRPIMVELMKFFPAADWKSLRSGDMPTIEIQPLEYMRGLTFKNCYVIVDEAQNATHEQIKMTLTRLGRGTKMILNGDVTQADLPWSARGGFERYTDMLEGIPGVGCVVMNRSDIVRDDLLKLIMERMELDEQLREERRESSQPDRPTQH